MVAEWHPNLQSDSHAHAVLTVEQKLDEARQVKIADLSHPPLDGVLALADRGFGNRLSIAVGLEFGEIQPLQQIGIKNLRAVKGAAGGREPRERRRVDGLGIMEPRVAAENLVRRFTGQRHGRFSPNGLEKPIQRREHVPGKTERKVAGLYDGAVQARIGKLSTIQDDFRVIAADMVHKIPYERRIRRLVEVARDEG